MRLRGRRVVLLLAGALPLVAEDSQNGGIAASTTTGAASAIASSLTKNHQPETVGEGGMFSITHDKDDDDDDENDFDDTVISTVEAIHEDAFRLPTLVSTVKKLSKMGEEDENHKDCDDDDDDDEAASSSSSLENNEDNQEGAFEVVEDDYDTIDGYHKGHRNTTPISPGSIEGDEDDDHAVMKDQQSKTENDVEQEVLTSSEEKKDNISHTQNEESSIQQAQASQESLESSSHQDLRSESDSMPIETEAAQREDKPTKSENEAKHPKREEATQEKEETMDSENNSSDSESSDLNPSDSDASTKDDDEQQLLQQDVNNNDSNSDNKDDKIEVIGEAVVDVKSNTTPEVVLTDDKNDGKNNGSGDDDDDDEQTDDEQTDDEDENSQDKRRVDVDYASKSAGALILEKSHSMKGTSNLLNGDKDKYAIAPCEDKKFVVIGLSEDILVKKIILVNYERYSSQVKDFKVLASQNLGTWVDLGTYTAKPGNGEQMFELIEPAWARYLKFRFLTHHGSEHFCTVSQIKVHGSTMLQGFHEQWEEDEAALKDEDENTVVADGTVVDPTAPIVIDTSTNKAAAEKGNEGQPVKHDEPSVMESANKQNTEEETSVPMSTQKEVGTGKEAHSESNAAQDHVQSSAESGPKEVSAEATDCPPISSSNGSSPIDCLVSSNQAAAVYENVAMVGPFRESQYLNELLRGDSMDEELLSTIYELIPRTLESLPSAGRISDDSHVLTPISELGTAAMQSLYTSTLKATDAAKSIVAESSGTIVAPKMSDALQEVFRLVKETVGSGSGIRSPDFVENHNHSSEATEELQAEDHEPHGITLDSKPEVRSYKKGESADDSSKHDVDSVTSPTSDKAEQIKTKNEREHPTEHALTDSPLIDSQSLHSVDLALAKMLDRLPSADCLTTLDYAEFKAKLLAARKGDGSSASSGTMEPIFKKLTGEIKSLQLSLSVHDQFTKASVSCYQRILLDLIVEMEAMRMDQNERLLKLENEFRTARSSGIMSLIARVMMPLFSWLLSFAKSTIYFALSVPNKLMEVVASSTGVKILKIQSWLLVVPIRPKRRNKPLHSRMLRKVLLLIWERLLQLPLEHPNLIVCICLAILSVPFL
jgi:hypothetical protein